MSELSAMPGDVTHSRCKGVVTTPSVDAAAVVWRDAGASCHVVKTNAMSSRRTNRFAYRTLFCEAPLVAGYRRSSTSGIDHIAGALAVMWCRYDDFKH